MKFKNLPVNDHFVISSGSSNSGKLFQKGNSSEGRRICFENGKVHRTRELVMFAPDTEVERIDVDSPDKPLGARASAAAAEENQPKQTSMPM